MASESRRSRSQQRVDGNAPRLGAAPWRATPHLPAVEASKTRSFLHDRASHAVARRVRHILISRRGQPLFEAMPDGGAGPPSALGGSPLRFGFDGTKVTSRSVQSHRAVSCRAVAPHAKSPLRGQPAHGAVSASARRAPAVPAQLACASRPADAGAATRWRSTRAPCDRQRGRYRSSHWESLADRCFSAAAK